MEKKCKLVELDWTFQKDKKKYAMFAEIENVKYRNSEKRWVNRGENTERQTLIEIKLRYHKLLWSCTLEF